MSGLELTRQYVDQYGGAVDVPPEVLARLESQRVFATLVYPNALAGYLLVAWAPVLVWVWVRGRGWARSVKWFSLVFLGLAAVVLSGADGVARGIPCVWRRGRH